MGRIKRIPKAQFAEIQKREWSIVKLENNAITDLFMGIPDSLLYAVYASGGPFPGVSSSNIQIPSANLIGGIDVFRNAPDDKVTFNKDCIQLFALLIVTLCSLNVVQ